MATGIGSPLALGGLYPSVDGRYVAANGKPFTSVSNAESALNGFPSKLSESCVGLTVLVKESEWTEAKEYWVQPKGTTPETYGLVEKGTTDYNDLDNKPTISDGGQGSAQIPIAGNIKVSASTASGETAGVSVTQGQTAGEIEMQFTLPKGDNGEDGANGVTPTIDPTSKHWMMGDTDTNIVAEGQDGQNGAPGHNPCLGRFASMPSTFAETPKAGDYYYVDTVIDATTTPPTVETKVYKYDGSEWDNGTVVDVSNQTFSSGETVIGTAIDGTGLDNPTPNALAKAGDVMRLKSQLKGITLEETPAVIGDAWKPSGATKSGYYKANGTGWQNSDNYASALIDVEGYKMVRFNGLCAQEGSALTYTWLDENSNILKTVPLAKTGVTSPYMTEYNVNVYRNAKYLLVISKYNGFSQFSLYCYLQNGDTVIDKINDTAGVPVVLSTSFSKSASRKVITSDFVRDGILAGTYEEEVIDLEHIIQMPLPMMEDTGNWGSGTNYKHTFVLVNPGDILYVKSNSNNLCLIGFVTDYNIHAGDPVGLTTGTSLKRYDESYILVPEGAKVALIYLAANNLQIPQSLILYRKVIDYPKDYQIEPITFSGVKISDITDVIYTPTYSGILLWIPKNFTAIIKVHKSAGSPDTYSKYSEYRYINTANTKSIVHGGTSGVKELQINIDATGSGVCYMFSSSYVTNVEVETLYNTDMSDGENAQFKALLDNATFNEIKVSSGTDVKGISTLDGVYFVTPCKIFSVTAGHLYKIIANGTKSAIVTFLTQSDVDAENLSVPSYCEKSSYMLVNKGQIGYFVAPNDATYMNIRMDIYAPEFIGEYIPGGVGEISKEDYLFFKSNFRGMKAQEAALIKQIEIGTSGNDSIGYEMPKSLQELNIIKKTKQFSFIKWTPKHTFYGKTDQRVYKAGVQQTSIPYSNNYDDYKQIGQTVSIHTFMTAVNNPYSVLYTERVSAEGSASVWGRTYHGPNGLAYYGAVCCSFASYVIGYKGFIGNGKWQNFANTYGITFQKFNRGEVNPQLLRIGDVLDNLWHSYVITGIKKDANGNVTHIRWAESSGGRYNVGGCGIGQDTLTNFINDKIVTLHGDSSRPMAVFALSEFGRNTEFEDYPEYVVINNDPTQTEDAAQPSELAPYNNDICTIYGDKATLAEGYRVVLNYNLTDTPTHTWTTIEVYKDDEPFGTYQLSAIDQSELPASQQGHALDLGNELQAGMYKARMTDGTNYSEYTFWEIISNNVTIDKLKDGVYKVINNTGKKILECVIGNYIQGETLGMERLNNGLIYPLSKLNTSNNYFTLYLKDYLADFGLSTDLNLNKKVLKLVVQGEYSAVATAVLFLPDVDYGLSSGD